MNILAEKKFLRKIILTARDACPLVVRVDASHAIVERLVAMPEYQSANVVLGYMNFGSEFASALWVQRVLADGKRLVLPRVDSVTQELELYSVDNLASQLASGSWGILEPVPERCERLIELNAVEFALLPGVAFTRCGARLGYGGGYYDKLLARMTPHPTLVAAAFALQIVQEIPQEPTDIRVAWVVTEQEIIQCSA